VKISAKKQAVINDIGCESKSTLRSDLNYLVGATLNLEKKGVSIHYKKRP